VETAMGMHLLMKLSILQGHLVIYNGVLMVVTGQFSPSVLPIQDTISGVGSFHQGFKKKIEGYVLTFSRFWHEPYLARRYSSASRSFSFVYNVLEDSSYIFFILTVV
jgi:hypothetical protein